MKNIIFVCTGNTCRSPMAEAFAKNICKNSNIYIASRGIFVSPSHINENSKYALSHHNIEHNNHIATKITIEDLKNAHLILTMEDTHKNILNDAVINANLSINASIFTLYEYTKNINKNIKDPYGLDKIDYINCANEIKILIEHIDFDNL